MQCRTTAALETMKRANADSCACSYCCLVEVLVHAQRFQTLADVGRYFVGRSYSHCRIRLADWLARLTWSAICNDRKNVAD